MRFGEGKSRVKGPDLIQVLDEVAFSLDKIYRESVSVHIVQRVSVSIKNGIKSTSYEAKECPLYVPDTMKEAFLRGNKYFGEKDISNNFIATMPFP